MKRLLFILSVLISQLIFSQEQTKHLSIPSTDEVVYSTTQVTSKPEFQGGEKELLIFIERNFKYPKVKGLKGNVLVSFIVEKNGSLTEIGILEDIGHGTGDEAIRVMKNSRAWIPGKLNGSPVRTQFLLTIPLKNKVI